MEWKPKFHSSPFFTRKIKLCINFKNREKKTNINTERVAIKVGSAHKRRQTDVAHYWHRLWLCRFQYFQRFQLFAPNNIIISRRRISSSCGTSSTRRKKVAVEEIPGLPGVFRNEIEFSRIASLQTFDC